MALLREQVECFRCGNMANKVDMRLVRTLDRKPQHECYSCFKRVGAPSWQKINRLKEKCDLFCEKCKYKFYSDKLLCPYCNQSDFLCKGKVNVHDLIK